MTAYRQQGYVLLVALIAAAFLTVVLVSSFERSSTEQRAATSSMGRASLEAAAESGLLRVERRLAAGACQLTSLQASFSCLEDIFSQDASLASFLDYSGSGAGTETSKHRFSQNPPVHLWLDNQLTALSSCTGSSLGDSCRVRVLAHAQAGADLNDPLLRLTASGSMRVGIPEFPPGSPLRNLFEDLNARDQTIFLGGDGLDPEDIISRLNPNQSNCIGGSGGGCQGGKRLDQLQADDFAGYDNSSLMNQVFSEISRLEGYGFPVIRIPTGSSETTFSMNQINSMTILIVEGEGDVRFTGSARDDETDESYPVLLLSQGSGTLSLATSGQNSMSGLVFAPSSHVRSVQGTPQLGLSIVANSLYLSPSTDLLGFDAETDFDASVNTNYRLEGSLDLDYH